MINRVYTNPGVASANPAAKSGTASSADAGSFTAVYNRMQELRTAAANRINSPFAAQTVETAPSYSSVYAPGVGGAYVQRPVELDEPEATLQKVEELQKDIQEKGLSGFFDGMDSKESFAYLFERYADAFGAGFLDDQWQLYARHRPPNESDQAKFEVANSFDRDMHRVLTNNFNFDWSSPDSGENIHNEWVEAFSTYFGYGDMTPEERYQAILADYNRSGDSSYAATYKLFWLLEKTGAADQQLMHSARSVLAKKQGREYASLDMTVTDMAKSRYANAYYGFDAAAEILKLVDHIHEMRERILATSPHLTDLGRYSDPNLMSFLKQLSADLKALGGVLGGIGA